MTARLLLIDPQNDFCDLAGAALPVAGADADMKRIAAFVESAAGALGDVVITLDSHRPVGIERTTFWKNASGDSIAPYTEVREIDVLAGRWQPEAAALLPEVLAYLHALEASGKYVLRVWPVHCVTGTWGHEIHASVRNAVADWESKHGKASYQVQKGLNPMTEQYSAVRAEVPRADDVTTQTNTALLQRVASSTDWLFIAGEASTHCVRSTFDDLSGALSAEQLRHTVLLTDCMSPVSGCVDLHERFFAEAAALGVRLLSSSQALSLLA